MADGFVIAWQDFSQGVGGATGDTDGSAVKAQVFSVNTEPTAAFSSSPNPVAPGVAVGFDASASSDPDSGNSIVTYAWDFGDGTTASGVSLTHAFSLFDTYTVALTVTDTHGATSSIQQTVAVNLGNHTPTADAGGPYMVAPGLSLALDGSGSSDPDVAYGDSIVSYAWDIDGDGQYDDASGIGPTLAAGQLAPLGHGAHTIGLRVTDSFGATASATGTLVVDAPPSGVDGTVTIDEDTTHTFFATDFGFSDPDSGDSLAAVRIDSLPAAGTLTLNGNPVAATDVVDATDLGLLVFTPDADANGAGYASFTFSVEDDNGAFAATPSTLTVDVTPVNDPPSGADATVTIDEDTSHTFSAGDFGFTDPDSGDSLAAVRIDSPPAAGTLTLNGNPVAATDVVDAADLGNLVFTPDADANGAGYASFTFSVEDNNGALATSPSTLSVDVTPVNDPPSGIDGTVTIDEDTTHTFAVPDFGFSDPDSGDSLAAVRIDSPPAAGTLTLNGNPVAATDVVDAADLGNLVFTPDADANGNGYASFTFSVEDDNGAFATSPSTLTVDVTPVNDPPSGADNTVTIDEDTTHTFSATDFGFSDPDSGDNLAAVRIDSLPTAGALTLDGSPVAATDVVDAADIGNLVFTPDANANGAGYASFTFSVEDDNGAFAASPSTLTVDVTPVNDPPAITSDGGGATAAVNVAENTTAVTTVTADDPDNTPTFSIVGGADQALFAIDATSGALTFLAAPDFEQPADNGHDNGYEVVVSATDSDLTDTQTIDVTVTNVAGVTIKGTGGADTVNADTTVDGQPGPTGEEDTIKGQGGKDTLYAGDGSDTILGGGGGDELYGEAGNDILNGNAGNDTLNGGEGDDVLTGSKGDDVFQFKDKLGPGNVDTITDFGRGHDSIDLAKSAFGGIGHKGHALAGKYFVVGSHAKDGNDHIIYQQGKGKLFYDPDGDGSQHKILFAKVDKGTHLDHTDFFVI